MSIISINTSSPSIARKSSVVNDAAAAARQAKAKAKTQQFLTEAKMIQVALASGVIGDHQRRTPAKSSHRQSASTSSSTSISMTSKSSQKRRREEESSSASDDDNSDSDVEASTSESEDDKKAACAPKKHKKRTKTAHVNTLKALQANTKSGGLATSLLASPRKQRGGWKQQNMFSQACAELQLSSAPPRLPCRDKERNSIMKFIEKGIMRGSADGGLYIAGVPGTGKSATVVRVISELAAREDLPNFEYVEINGMKLPEAHQLYTVLWEKLTGKRATPARAAIHLDQRFRTRNLKRPICVLLVDELDYIMTHQQNVLYNLFDWPGRSTARLIVIGISNTIDLPDLLMPRVHSRLGLTKLYFEPYTSSEIRTIIHDRLREIHSFDEDGIELCARKIASVSGDIRRALQICRRAAEICEEDEIRAKILKEQQATMGMANMKSTTTTVAPTASSGTGAHGAATGASSSSSSKVVIGAGHITRAIDDLQNSNSIHYLSHSSTPYDKILLSGMLSSMKYSTGGINSGATNPVISLIDLIGHTERNMDTRGIDQIVAKSEGVKQSMYPKMTIQDWCHIVHQWSDMKLVQLTHRRGERWPHVQLNILTDDIDYAFKGDELWDKLRSATA
jgi:hypothetical protein